MFTEQFEEFLELVEGGIGAAPILQGRARQALGAQARTRVEAGSVMQLRAATKPLDLILADPPYQSGAGEVALDRLLRLGWIGPETWVAVETGFKEDIAVKGLTLEADRRVGKGKLSLMRLAPSDADPAPSEEAA